MANRKNTVDTEEVVTAETTAETTAQTTAVTENERVKLFVPRYASNGEPDLYVCINGKGYQLPRGKEHLVPPEVAAEVNRSLKAKEWRDENAEALAGIKAMQE